MESVEYFAANVADCKGAMDALAETRPLVSVDSTVFKLSFTVSSVAKDVFANDASVETATLRVLTSLERDVLNPASITVKEETPTLSALDNDETLTTRVLVSADSTLCKVESTTVKEYAAALNAVDNDNTEVLRALVSLEIEVPSVEFTTVRDDAEVLNVWDNEVTDVMRTLVSVESAVEREMCELKMLVAKALSGPISFFKLVNVSRDSLKLLTAAIVAVKLASVANTLELYLG